MTTYLLDIKRETRKYPNDNINVIYHFQIDINGNVNDVRVMRKGYALLDKEAIRVIKSMPQWKPGKDNGKLVEVEFVIPIRFKLY